MEYLIVLWTYEINTSSNQLRTATAINLDVILTFSYYIGYVFVYLAHLI